MARDLVLIVLEIKLVVVSQLQFRNRQLKTSRGTRPTQTHFVSWLLHNIFCHRQCLFLHEGGSDTQNNKCRIGK